MFFPDVPTETKHRFMCLHFAFLFSTVPAPVFGSLFSIQVSVFLYFGYVPFVDHSYHLVFQSWLDFSLSLGFFLRTDVLTFNVFEFIKHFPHIATY